MFYVIDQRPYAQLAVLFRVLSAMNWKKYISHRSLLAAIFFGLNVLCFVGVTHGRHAHRLTHVNYSHIPAHGTGRAGSRTSGRSETVFVVDTQVIHATADSGKRTTSATTPTASFAVLSTVAPMLRRPTFMAELLVRENVLALGSSPRAPGLGRAPPVTA